MAEKYNFGKKLREYRKKRKMTQAQLANLLGKSTSTIYGYETNQILPSYDTVCLISTVLDADIEALLDLEEKLQQVYSHKDRYTRYAKGWREFNHGKV